jgi:hypothetical protein
VQDPKISIALLKNKYVFCDSVSIVVECFLDSISTSFFFLNKKEFCGSYFGPCVPKSNFSDKKMFIYKTKKHIYFLDARLSTFYFLCL